MHAIGIDIGGTKIAIGIVDPSGNVTKETKIPMDLSLPPSEMVSKIVTVTKDLLELEKVSMSEIKGIGVGAPGPLDPAQGKITCPPNLPSWENFLLVDELKNYFSIPIVMENDASAAAVAEKWIGAAKESDNFIYITVSTGIGSGIFINGKLMTGGTGNAGEVGHIVIDPAQGLCACGQKGCWEFVASGTAIARRGSEVAGKPLSTKKVFELAEAGDEKMMKIVDETFYYLGVGCVTLINIFDTEKLVIGGGVSQIGEKLFSSIRDYVSRNALNPSGRQTEVVSAYLQQSSGVVGAAALVHLDYN